jgi:DNA-binding transcriptional LysR family regulator
MGPDSLVGHCMGKRAIQVRGGRHSPDHAIRAAWSTDPEHGADTVGDVGAIRFHRAVVLRALHLFYPAHYEGAGVGTGLVDRLHVINFFPLVCRIVESSHAIGVVATSGTNNRAFQNKIVALSDIDLFKYLPLCCAVRTRWPAKPAMRALIAQFRRQYGDGVNKDG